MKRLTLIFIKLYQGVLSPFFGIFIKSECRFTPSCSDYSYYAVEKYGFLKGLLMSVKRILKCNPFANPGFDPVE